MSNQKLKDQIKTRVNRVDIMGLPNKRNSDLGIHKKLKSAKGTQSHDDI